MGREALIADFDEARERIAQVDKWLATAMAIGALAGIEVHLLNRSEIVITRGPLTTTVRSRRDLARVLKLMGCIDLPPPP